MVDPVISAAFARQSTRRFRLPKQKWPVEYWERGYSVRHNTSPFCCSAVPRSVRQPAATTKGREPRGGRTGPSCEAEAYTTAVRRNGSLCQPCYYVRQLVSVLPGLLSVLGQT